MTKKIGRVLKLGGGAADQYLFAGTNLIPSLAVARSSDVNSFALFSSVFLAYVLFLGASRALFSEPAAIRSLKEDSFEAIERAARTLVWRNCLTAAPLFLALLLAVTVFFEDSAIGQSPIAWLVLMAVGFPFHALQDLSRTVLIAARKPLRPLFSDIAWFVVAAAGFFPLHFPPVTWACVTFVLGGILACVIVCPPLPAKSGGIRILWSDVYSRPSLAEYLMQPAVVQGSVLLCGAVGSPSSLAALRGGTMLFRPIGLLINTHRVLSFGSSNRAIRGLASVQSTGLLVSTLGTVIFAVFMWFLPDHIGHAVLGATWSLVHAALVPLALAQVFGLAGYVIVTDLKVHRIIDGLGSIRLAGVVAIPTMTVLGAIWQGPMGAAWGLCAGQGVGLAWVSRRAAIIRRKMDPPAG